MTTERLAQLRENLIEYFDLEELCTLCFDLGVDYDSLRGEGKADKARELLSYLEHRGRLRHLIQQCNKLRPNVVWQEILDTVEAEPPFKGLEYFDVTDADLFFGREQLTADLVGRLQQNRFLAVVGASGSGKSSVVRAGLIPALKRGEPLVNGILPPKGSTRWLTVVITPGAHPLREIAASLTPSSESIRYTAQLIDDLQNDARCLDLAVSRFLKHTDRGNRLLLVVDQFEELFTACKDEVERKAFVDNLMLAVAPETEGATIAIIALRADFYPHCGQYAGLRDALEKYQAYIGPMSANELRRAIEEPTKHNGLELETGLVDLLLRDVGDEPGTLPLLSHALLETWKRRHGRMLTLGGYYDCGGVRGAIAQTAEVVYGCLTPEQQVIARNIFLRLTELGECTQDTRRRAALGELVPHSENAYSVEAVLRTLIDGRLVITSEGAAEVAHEALIREWPRLRQWLDEDRAGLLLHRQLTRDAHDWLALNRDPGALYRGTRLTRVAKWSGDHSSELSALEREFLSASRESAEQERAKDEVVETGRKKMARDLIDEVAGTIAAVAMRANFTRKLLERDSTKVEEELAKIEELARKASKNLRHIMLRLRPLALEMQGLTAALQQYFLRAQEVDSTVNIHLEAHSVEDKIDLDTKGIVYYLIMEAVGNARKYAKANNIWVRLKLESSGLIAQVQDNGEGFDVKAFSSSARGSLMMANIYERVQLINGDLSIESRLGQGTCVTLRVPLKDKS